MSTCRTYGVSIAFPPLWSVVSWLLEVRGEWLEQAMGHSLSQGNVRSALGTGEGGVVHKELVTEEVGQEQSSDVPGRARGRSIVNHGFLGLHGFPCLLSSAVHQVPLISDFDQPAPQHFLYFFPLPQGHGSFRPGRLGLSARSISGAGGCCSQSIVGASSSQDPSDDKSCGTSWRALGISRRPSCFNCL